MDKEKEKGNVDTTNLHLLKFPEQDEETEYQEYEINIVFSSGKNILIVCSGFVPMIDVGVGMVGFWSTHSEDIHTIVNFNKVDFVDVEKREV